MDGITLNDYVDVLLYGWSRQVVGTVALVLLLYGLRGVAHRTINGRVEKLNRRYAWRQGVNYVVGIVGAMLLVTLWFEVFASLWTLLSLVAAALVIVSKEVLINFVASSVIVGRQLFEVGDRISIGDRAGDVIAIGPLYFSLAEIGGWVEADEPTGRIVRVPNSLVLTQTVTRYATRASLLWNEVTIELKLESDWERARAIAREIVQEVGHPLSADEVEEVRGVPEEIVFLRTDPSVFLRVRNGKLALTLRYLCKFHKRRASEQRLWEALLARFHAEPEIHLAA